MGVRFQYWLATFLSALLLALVIATMWLLAGNIERQQEAAKNQMYVQQIQQVELPLYRELAQALAELARRGDTQIASMLTTQGIQLTPQQPSSPQQAAGGTEASPASTDEAAPSSRDSNRRERAPRTFKPAAGVPAKPN